MEQQQQHHSHSSPTPARLDFLQSLSGLILGLFMFGHLFAVSAILVNEDFAYWVDKQLEGAFLRDDGHGYPFLVTVIAAIIFAIFIIHALLAMRKFPHTWKEYRAIQKHMHAMHHEDTTHWFWQVYTGFILFFFGSAHVLKMMIEPEGIGPYQAADRYYSDHMWIFYSILLTAFVIHGIIGMYRLAVKWGWFEGIHPRESRHRLRIAKRVIGGMLLAVGFATIVRYTTLGYEHRDRVGEKFIPAKEMNQMHPDFEDDGARNSQFESSDEPEIKQLHEETPEVQP